MLCIELCSSNPTLFIIRNAKDVLREFNSDFSFNVQIVHDACGTIWLKSDKVYGQDFKQYIKDLFLLLEANKYLRYYWIRSMYMNNMQFEY